MNEPTEDQKILTARLEYERLEKKRKLLNQIKGSPFDSTLVKVGSLAIMASLAFWVMFAVNRREQWGAVISFIILWSFLECRINALGRRLNAMVELRLDEKNASPSA